MDERTDHPPGRFSVIVDSIKSTYGDLKHPDYHFAVSRRQSLESCNLVRLLRAEFRVENHTDLNNDLSVRLLVYNGQKGVAICLSFVEPWAMAFSLNEGSQEYAAVIDSQPARESEFESRVIQMLLSEGFLLLTLEEASEPLCMSLFETQSNEVRVFHAIVSDEGFIPKILKI